MSSSTAEAEVEGGHSGNWCDVSEVRVPLPQTRQEKERQRERIEREKKRESNQSFGITLFIPQGIILLKLNFITFVWKGESLKVFFETKKCRQAGDPLIVSWFQPAWP